MCSNLSFFKVHIFEVFFLCFLVKLLWLCVVMFFSYGFVYFFECFFVYVSFFEHFFESEIGATLILFSVLFIYVCFIEFAGVPTD